MHNSESYPLKVTDVPDNSEITRKFQIEIPYMSRVKGCCLTRSSFPASPAGVNGLRMLGVVHEAVVFLLEQLYGSRHCRSYRFRFHKPEDTDEPPLNPHGSARAEIHHRLERGL